MKESKKIWMDGKFCSWKDAQVHILTHTLHYGVGVFEGIRCYSTKKGSAVFRLTEHIERLFNSAHIMQLKIPYTREELFKAVLETIKINELPACYIRPIVYLGYGQMGLNPIGAPINVAIAVWPWGKYLGEEGVNSGIRIKVSSYTRLHNNIYMTKAKVCGSYVNSILAKREALEDGYDEALLLDTEGFAAEGSGENLFIIKNGKIKTPPVENILPGITRDSIFEIVEKYLRVVIKEERFTRDELYIADEAFLTGTAAEITPIREVDRRQIGKGKPGPITKKIEGHFYKIVNGEDRNFQHWLTYIK